MALAVVSLCLITAFSYEIPLDNWLLCFVFFSTVVGYNFAKYFPARKESSLKKPKSYNYIIALSVISMFGLLVSCFFLEKETIITSVLLSGFNFFYAMPAPNKTLREIPFLKVFIIAFIWTAVTFGLPFIESRTEFDYSIPFYIVVLERFCWIILLLVPFEIRDYNYDKQYLKTLATVFGILPLKIVGIALVLILCTIRITVIGYDNIAFYSLVYLSLIIAVIFSKKQQSDYYASFWVEGLPVLWLVGWLILDGISYFS